jgi:outer membrane immunogenic protein
MNFLIRFVICVGAMVGVTSVAGFSQALKPSEVGVSYLYTHTNAPPGGCGCFAMNGAGAWVAFHVTDHLAIVGEVSGQNASNVLGSGTDLTVISYTAGPRYSWRKLRSVVPFGQALFGGAHASGNYYPTGNGLYGSNSFAITVGGGLDLPVCGRLTVRAIEADYYLTRFANVINDHQNNLRIGAGVIFRLGAQ